MWPCIRNCILKKLWGMVIVGIILALLAGVIAAFGGLAIVVGPITLGVVTSAILAALLVFGLVIAMVVIACVVSCALPSAPPDDSGDAGTVPPTDDRDEWPPPVLGG